MNRKRLFLSSIFLSAALIAPMAITANAAPQRNQQADNAQTYMGKIDKKQDQYILLDKDKKASYKLDDATKAEKFNGDDVKVVGTLDSSTNMIHVQSIEKLHD